MIIAYPVHRENLNPEKIQKNKKTYPRAPLQID